VHRRDTRPSTDLVADRSQGVQLATIQELARYWIGPFSIGTCRRIGDHPGAKRSSYSD